MARWQLLMEVAIVIAFLMSVASAADGEAVESFPWCRCDRTSFDTPYRIIGVQENETATTRDYTFTFSTSGCYIKSPCCGMDLNKLALHAKENCDASSIAKVAVNTILVDYRLVSSERVGQFRSYGENRLMFKVANLRWIYEDTEDSTITLSLKKGAPCDTLGKFLQTNTLALIDKATRCCPTMALPPIAESQ